MMRMEEEHIVRDVLRTGKAGTRKIARPTARWKNACQRDHTSESGRGDGQESG